MGVIKRQGLKNTITVYIGFFIGFANIFLIQPHFLTKEEIGLTRVLFSFSYLIATLVPIGIANTTIRYFPSFKDREKKHHGYFGFMNLFPLVGYVFFGLLIWFFRDFIMNQYRRESPLFVEYFHFIFPLIFFNTFVIVLTAYCGSNYKSTIPAFINDVLVKIFTIVVVSLYFIKWVNRDQFIFLFMMIFALQLILILVYVFAFDKPGFKIDWPYFKKEKIWELIRYGLLLWFAGISSLGLKYFDTIMIGKYLPLALVGVYSIASFIPTVIEAPANALERIGAAKIAFAWNENDIGQISEIYKKSSIYMFLFGGFLFLNININSHAILSFLPEGYQQVEMVILIISTGTLFNMSTGLNIPILFNSDKYKYGAFLLIFLAVFVIVLQMILIPQFGLNGAAFSTALAAFLYNAIIFFFVYRFFGLQPLGIKNLWVFILVVGLFFSSFLITHVQNAFADIFIRSSVISTVYLALVYCLKLVPEFHHYLPWEKRKEL